MSWSDTFPRRIAAWVRSPERISDRKPAAKTGAK
jgi:hypothetical protein